MIGSSNDEINFPRKLLVTNTQDSKIRKAFANGSSANIKFSKTRFFKMIQSGGFPPYEVTGPLIKGLKSMSKFTVNKSKSVLKNKDKTFDTMKTVQRY